MKKKPLSSAVGVFTAYLIITNKLTTMKNEYNKPAETKAIFGYRFLVTSNRNNEILGTGFFKTSRKMTRDEQLSFFHQYTNGMHQNKEAFISIDIFEAEA